MSTVNLNDTQENTPVRLNHVCKLRIKEVKPHTKQDTGAKSIKVEFEIADVGGQQSIHIDGVERGVSGITLRRYVSVEQDKLGSLAALHKAAGLPLEFEFSEDMVPMVDYVGAELSAHVRSKQQTRNGDDGQPLVNPNTGEALVSYQHEISEFLKR